MCLGWPVNSFRPSEFIGRTYYSLTVAADNRFFFPLGFWYFDCHQAQQIKQKILVNRITNPAFKHMRLITVLKTDVLVSGTLYWTCWLTVTKRLIETLTVNGMLIDTVSAVIFLLWQIKMSAVKRSISVSSLAVSTWAWAQVWLWVKTPVGVAGSWSC